MNQAVATGVEYDSVLDQAIRAGVDNPIMEWVRDVPIRSVMPQRETQPIYDPDRIYTREELPYVARIHLDHAGEWVAWDVERTLAVATGTDYIPLCGGSSRGVVSPAWNRSALLVVRPPGTDREGGSPTGTRTWDPANSFALALRPMLWLGRRPLDGRAIEGLVDSGSDDTLLPDYLITQLGITN